MYLLKVKITVLEKHTYLVYVLLNRISYNVVHFPPFPSGSNKSKLHLPDGIVNKFYTSPLFQLKFCCHITIC